MTFEFNDVTSPLLRLILSRWTLISFLFLFFFQFHPVIPFILEDVRRQMDTWGTDGTFDPFDKVYEVRAFSPIFLLSLEDVRIGKEFEAKRSLMLHFQNRK